MADRKKRVGQNLALESVDSLLGNDEQQDLNGITQLEITDLIDFSNHPFKVIQEDPAMLELIKSIREIGVIQPLEVRQSREVAGKYEVIAGHRRKYAAKEAGLTSVPCFVLELDDDTAILRMVDSNLYRPFILPSEKAFAYKMRLDAMKRQGKRTDLTSAQVGQKSDGKTSKDILAEQIGESRNQIQRYIRLTNLTHELLEFVDAKKIPFNVGVSASYLEEMKQIWLYELIRDNDYILSIAGAEKFRKLEEERKLTKEVMEVVLADGSEKNTSISLKTKSIVQYFPPDTSKKEMEETILKLLDNWMNQRA